MFTELYNFFYQWLFADGLGALSLNGAEFVTILFTIITLVSVLYLALIPIRFFFNLFFRG